MFALSSVLLLLLSLEDYPVNGESPLVSTLLRPIPVVTSSTTPPAVPSPASLEEDSPPSSGDRSVAPSPQLDAITLEEPQRLGNCPRCALESLTHKGLSGESEGGTSSGGSPPPSAPMAPPPHPHLPLDREGLEEVIRSLRVSAIKAKILSHLQELGAPTMKMRRRDLPSILTEGHFLMHHPPPRPTHHVKNNKRLIVVSNSSVWCEGRTPHPSATFQITIDEALLELRQAAAVLWAWKVPDGGDSEPQLLRLREITAPHDRNGGGGGGAPRRRGWTVSHNVTRLSEGWLHFDVTQALRKWQHSLREALNYQHTRTLELEVTCPTCSSPRHALPIDANTRHRPFLVVEGLEATDLQPRLRRSTGGARSSSSSKSSCSSASDCCLKPLHIDFEDLGWDHYVVHPKSYSASYCSGTCLGRYHGANNYSSLIRTMMMAEDSSLNATMRAALTPCCTPTGFKPLPVLLQSPNNSIRCTELPEMVVTGCKCYF